MSSESVDWEEFEKSLHQYCREEAEEEVNNQPESPLEEKEQKIQRLYEEKKQESHSFKEMLKLGWLAILQDLKENDPVYFDKLTFHLKLSNDSWDKVIGEQSSQPGSYIGKLADKLEWPNDLMHAIYKSSVSMYQARKFQEATAAFTTLVSWDSASTDYWVGLGLCRQMGFQDYLGACNAYFAAMEFNPKNPYIYVYYAECLDQLGEEASVTRHFLDLALEMMNEQEDVEDLRTYCISLKRKLETKSR